MESSISKPPFLKLLGNSEAKNQLIEEGYVNELVSKVQTMRKDAGFEVVEN